MKRLSYFIIGLFFVLILACSQRSVQTLALNNITHGKVVYFAKSGNNVTGQIGNPNRPFADPWAAIAATPGTGWFIKCLDVETYTFGSVGSGADFEHDSTTVDGTFNFVKNGCVVDFNGATLKYLKHPTVKKLLRNILSIDSNATLSIKNLKLDLSQVDTVITSYGKRGVVIGRLKGVNNLDMHFLEYKTPVITSMDYTYNYFMENYDDYDGKNSNFDLTIEKASGGTLGFSAAGVDNYNFNIHRTECIWNYFEMDGSLLSTGDNKFNLNIGVAQNHLDFYCWGIDSRVNVGVWNFHMDSVLVYKPGFRSVPFGVLVDSAVMSVKVGSASVYADSLSGSINTNAVMVVFGNTGGSSIGDCVVEFDKLIVGGVTAKPVGRFQGNVILRGTIIGGNTIKMNSSTTLDISQFKFVTADTASIGGTSGTVLCNGFISNKAITGVITKVGTEFINASAF